MTWRSSPVINKIDLPNAEVERVLGELEETIGFDRDQVILASAKTGEGVGRSGRRWSNGFPPGAIHKHP